MREPKTPGEWQHVVNAADICQALETARQFGLVSEDGKINLSRCEQILREGKKIGPYLPRHKAMDAFIRSLSDHLHV